MWIHLHWAADGVGSSRDGISTIRVHGDRGLPITFISPVCRRSADSDLPASGTVSYIATCLLS
jgi:hypothetical protein